jgi:hypothetical protein
MSSVGSSADTGSGYIPSHAPCPAIPNLKGDPMPSEALLPPACIQDKIPSLIFLDRFRVKEWMGETLPVDHAFQSPSGILSLIGYCNLLWSSGPSLPPFLSSKSIGNTDR